MQSHMLSNIDHPEETLQLCKSALRWLASMFDESTQLFCHRRKLTSEGLINEGASHRYTAITLLGLLEANEGGLGCAFDIERILVGLVNDIGWIEGVGDLGLLLWLCSRASTQQLRALCAKIDVDRALLQGSDARQGKTTELAWFLTGLSEAALAMPEERAAFHSVALIVHEMLLRNQGGSGLFGHQAKRSNAMATLRSHIGCFADQVYPIYALTRLAAAFEECDSVLAAAQRCGSTICELQGEQGQWWWHYDARQEQVFGRYPVFAVHQDGMAPMALLALEKITGQNFSSYVYKGLAWIYGNNELRLDMRDDGRQVIWRSICDSDRYARYLAGGLSLLGLRESGARPSKLQVKCECRPYHLGWLLYAFGKRAQFRATDDGGHEMLTHPSGVRADSVLHVLDSTF